MNKREVKNYEYQKNTNRSSWESNKLKMLFDIFQIEKFVYILKLYLKSYLHKSLNLQKNLQKKNLKNFKNTCKNLHTLLKVQLKITF